MHSCPWQTAPRRLYALSPWCDFTLSVQGAPASPTSSPPRSRYPQKGHPATTPQQPLATIPEHHEGAASLPESRLSGDVQDVDLLEVEGSLPECFPDLIELPPAADAGGEDDGSTSSGEGEDGFHGEPEQQRRRQGDTQYRLVLPERITRLPDVILPGGGPGGGRNASSLPNSLQAGATAGYHPYALVPYVPPEQRLLLGLGPAAGVAGAAHSVWAQRTGSGDMLVEMEGAEEEAAEGMMVLDSSAEPLGFAVVADVDLMQE